jgi:hypothetical protein
MPGKHRGPSRSGKVTTNMSRFTLDPPIERAFQAMVLREQRSVANMASVLITEAIEARLRRAAARPVNGS